MTVSAIDPEADASAAVDAPPASMLRKAHLLLEAFTAGTSTLGLTELSRRSGVPKASAHRLAAELTTLGLLTKTSKGYQLGWRIFELGQMVPGPASLRAVARPTLMDLRTATRAIVHLSVARGLDTLYLERFAGRNEFAAISVIGSRVPSHTTASGVLFLAYGDPEILAELPPDALSHLGVRDRVELERRFGAIRDRRCAEEPRQCVPGMKTIAVPVMYPGTDRVIAAISATTPVDRNADKQIAHALWAAAGEISRGIAGGRSRRRHVG